MRQLNQEIIYVSDAKMWEVVRFWGVFVAAHEVKAPVSIRARDERGAGSEEEAVIEESNVYFMKEHFIILKLTLRWDEVIFHEEVRPL